VRQSRRVKIKKVKKRKRLLFLGLPLLRVFEDGRISTSVLRAELSCQGNLAFSVFPTSSSTSSTRGNIRRFPHPSFLDGRGEGVWLWQATTTKGTKEASSK
jgi:hypothetical protein